MKISICILSSVAVVVTILFAASPLCMANASDGWASILGGGSTRKTGSRYSVTMKKINVDGGWDPTCGGPPTALVYSPDAAGKFPLLSFAHGMTAGGNKVDRSYSKLLREVAGAGYVIIATQDAPDAFCANMYKDQLKSIDIGKRFRNVDVSKGFGIFGHSMGGQSTFNSAGSKRDIRAAVALHPATFGGSTPKVPILYGTGSSDRMTGCSPRSVKGLYDRTSLSNMNRPGIYNRGKVFANIRGAGHTEPNFGSKWNRFVIAMFDCHIKRNPSSCGVIYGRGRDSLCHGSLNMVQCITAGGDGGGGVSIPLSNLLDQDVLRPEDYGSDVDLPAEKKLLGELLHTMDGGYGGGEGGASLPGLGSLGNLGHTLQISGDEELLEKQMNRGFQRLRARSTLQMRAGVDERYLERSIRGDLATLSNIPSEYWIAIENQIKGAFYTEKSTWENREFMFNIGKGCRKFEKKKMDKREFKKYLKSLPKHERKEAKRKWKTEKFWERQCPVHLVGIYVARNKPCKTFDYIITHVDARFKLAADIYLIKETNSILGFEFGKIRFDKKKQALSPKMADYIMGLVSQVGLDRTIQCSPDFFHYKPTHSNRCEPGLPFQGNCAGAPTPPDDGGSDYMDIQNEYGRRRLNQVKEWKRECKTECASERYRISKRICKQKCVQRKRREKQLDDKTTPKDRRHELCKAHCEEKGEPYPEFTCYPKCMKQFHPIIPSNPEVAPFDDPNWTPPVDPVWEDPLNTGGNDGEYNGGSNDGGYNGEPNNGSLDAPDKPWVPGIDLVGY